MQDEFTFYVWKLNDFSILFNSDGRRLKSPSFSLSEDKQLKFCLHFYNKSPVKFYENFVAIGLGIEQFGTHKSVKVDFSIWIEDVNGEVLKSDIVYIFDSELRHRARVFRSFAERKELDPTGKFVKNDALTIFCRIRRELEKESSEIFGVENRLKTAYDSNLFSDIKIEVCDVTFSAHKFILASYSEVFFAMLSNPLTKESQTNLIQINDDDPKIFKAMLEYFYSGKVENLDVIVEKLCEMADKYQVKSLMDICIDHLCNDLSAESVSSILAFAFRYNILPLKERLIDFGIHNFKEIMQSNEWKILRSENAILSGEIFDAILAKSDIECFRRV